MPRNSSGVYSQPAGTAAVANTTIGSAPYNNLVADIGNELTNSLPTTGVKGMGAALPMGGFKITGMADPVAATDAATKNYTDSSISGATTRFVGGTSTGSANAQVLATTAPNTFALTAGNEIDFNPGFTNSGAVTLQVGALAAKNVLKRTPAGPAALAGSEIIAGQRARVIYDGTQFLLGELATLTSPTIVTPTITQPSLTLKQSATPTPTAEGDIQWDTDDNVLAIGDSAATRLFVPVPANTAVGDVEYFSAAKATARLAIGTAGQVMQVNAGATAPQWATVPFTRSYDSGQQTITSGGALTLAHGFGVQPKLYLAVLQCVTAEGGFSVGDETQWPPNGSNDGSGSANGYLIYPDATNVNIRFGNNSPCMNPMPRKDTGGDFTPTQANWKLVVRAWA
ncbi:MULTISPECIES: hypothetical protein [unclassified Mesorhizobium]|uniref:hypothetical protein n=1 Tax=unclassified Mesorhizobium TaxID=325217 RepID=UPI000FCBEB8F|nr:MULTISPECIES: hypothetical protein [unclassified Mesorhizobium]RUV12406.1 hypothetical protein EOA91_28060 [Mesorhizobium sp. M1A.F.Ca.IN.022.04.1.1]RWG26253.1 MAG: hypothetical protein EOQ60_27825 [Mesorhizobium sp.]